MMRKVDALAEGKGLVLAQAKIMRAVLDDEGNPVLDENGEVVHRCAGYQLSKRPKFKPWDVIAWAWYFVHRRSLIKERQA